MQVQDDKPYDDINVTPMLDLAYVLLVIFILMCTASVQGMRANLPTASKSSAPQTKKVKPHAVVVDKDGGIHFDNADIPISMAQLEQNLNQARSEDPDFPFVVRGDSLTQYQKVMDVLDLAGRLGITQIGLSTKPKGN
jgi:biopolymer transport protein ExbD